MNIENLIIQEKQSLQKEHQKRITAGFFSKTFQTFAYQKQCAMFDDYLTEKWQWSMLHKLRDNLSDKFFIGEKAVITSSIFSSNTAKVDDYGGFAIREPFGEVSFCHVATWSDHKRHEKVTIMQKDKKLALMLWLGMVFILLFSIWATKKAVMVFPFHATFECSF